MSKILDDSIIQKGLNPLGVCNGQENHKITKKTIKKF